jgi:hypothetical protein
LSRSTAKLHKVARRARAVVIRDLITESSPKNGLDVNVTHFASVATPQYPQMAVFMPKCVSDTFTCAGMANRKVNSYIGGTRT